ncbi:5-oxoprolinase subunit PxpB [Lentibacillus sp. Marseille-P4043]|uniref:5-oxoprolinase subunit PxpB n=1 Tax=Lentibacillus sp. Marseille-P4043 TaxID=2040293 RepID=UPI000D0BE04A|nr:5-oxoprolinase subunit PxpB [Lentibacillus sp. Marseille-P4043]
MDFVIKSVGDNAIIVQFEEIVSPKLNAKIKAFCRELENALQEYLMELVPGFDSVTIYYQINRITYQEICERVSRVASTIQPDLRVSSKLVHIPVLYGDEYGPDLDRVATFNQLSIEDVIAIHRNNDYLVYMLGFLPGFPYLGGMDRKIATPRLDQPRQSVFAGAVGIAHEQTGIYPMGSPGGWNIIGKTPLTLFDQVNQEFLLQAGSYVRFYEVSQEAFAEIEKEVAAGTFDVKISEK